MPLVVVVCLEVRCFLCRKQRKAIVAFPIECFELLLCCLP